MNHLLKVMTRKHHTEMRGVLSRYINPESVVFDVGGHAGQFTKLFSDMASSGQVFVFEPAIYSRSILQIMAGMKFLQNVYILPFGLSNKVKHAEIYTPVKKSGSLGYGLAFVGSNENYKREVIASDIILSTMDHVVNTLAINKVDFIKADIEGSELLLLQGGKETLKKYKPVLLLEISDKALERNNHSGRELVSFLREVGYQKIEKINVETGVVECEVKFAEAEFNGDYLFT